MDVVLVMQSCKLNEYGYTFGESIKIQEPHSYKLARLANFRLCMCPGPNPTNINFQKILFVIEVA